MIDHIDDFVWGKADEPEFLRKVIEQDNVDSESILRKLKGIQGELQQKLRAGVDENYPKLLEQVQSIEILDQMQSEFDEEMRIVNDKAENVGHLYMESFERLKSNTLALEKLVKLSRVLNDGLRCQHLINICNEERDLLAKAECVNEIKILCSENSSNFAAISWMKEGFLRSVPNVSSQTSKMAIVELKGALQSLSIPHVNNCLKALHLLFDSDGSNREIKTLLDEAIHDIDALLLNLAKSSEKVIKQLPQLGSKLQKYLEQFQLLGTENAQYFSNRVASLMRQRMPADAEYALRLVQIVSKSLLLHSDAIAKPIRDALGPLKASVLSQSLANLFELVNETFSSDEKKGTLIEKLNSAMKAEISNVNWDPELQKQIEGNIAKALQMIGSKIEAQLMFNEETLRLSGRVSKAQSVNYQLLSTAHAFRKQWPLYSDSLRSVIDPHVQVIVDEMRKTTSLVIESMHMEKFSKQSTQSSMFMGELCDHLKVFRTHVAQIEPLAESLDALPNFINFVIEQYLLHVSLMRPFAPKRYAKDLTVLCKSLQTFNCNSSKYLNAQKPLVDFLNGFPSSLEKVHRTVPSWLQIQLLIADSPNLCLPHESADWPMNDFVRWFNEHSDAERCQFLQNLIASFEQSSAADRATTPHLAEIKSRLMAALTSL